MRRNASGRYFSLPSTEQTLAQIESTMPPNQPEQESCHFTSQFTPQHPNAQTYKNKTRVGAQPTWAWLLGQVDEEARLQHPQNLLAPCGLVICCEYEASNAGGREQDCHDGNAPTPRRKQTLSKKRLQTQESHLINDYHHHHHHHH